MWLSLVSCAPLELVTPVQDTGCDVAEWWFQDADGDGFGDEAFASQSCVAYRGWVTVAGDCDDNNAAVHLDAVEVCDGVDNNCDGLVDSGTALVEGATYWPDEDGDGFGAFSDVVHACTPPKGFVTNAEDCDDTNTAVNPSAVEVCDPDNVDEDCDGVSNLDDPSFEIYWIEDADGDGYGVRGGKIVVTCDPPNGYATLGGDCDDADPNVHPGEVEVCDAFKVDEDCNGYANTDDPAFSVVEWFEDGDGDGFGDDATWSITCAPASGWVTTGGDCDDANDAAHPGTAEVCDDAGIDEDCNGLADWEDPAYSGTTSWFEDADGDGYGDDTTMVQTCAPTTGRVGVGGDCDDLEAAVHPGAAELCDGLGIDEDCNGLADTDDPLFVGVTRWYVDDDGDGYGVDSTLHESCFAASGLANAGGDCDDADSGVNPGVVEVCDAYEVDEDCNGLSNGDDPALTSNWSFTDLDGDGYGDPATRTFSCTVVGDVLQGGDCDDADDNVNRGAEEVCWDGIDNDCTLVIDDCVEDAVVASDNASFRLQDAHGSLAGSNLQPAGDADGDGFHDLVAAAPGDGSGTVMVFLGPISGNAEIADASHQLTAPSSSVVGFGEGLAAGEHDGDGVGDLLVAALGHDEVWLIQGPLSAASSMIEVECEDSCGTNLGFLGDWAGDGDPDVLVTGLRGADAISYVMAGPITTSTDVTLSTHRYVGSEAAEGWVSGPVADLNGDGIDEMAIGSPAEGAGTIDIVFGGEDAPGEYALSDASDIEVMWSLTESWYTGDDPSGLGRQVPTTGDVDGDGAADLVVACPGCLSRGSGGQVAVFGAGTSGPVGMGDAMTLIETTMASNYWDLSVASGDANGDVFDDLVIGSTFTESAFLVLGPASGTWDLDDAKRGEVTGSEGELGIRVRWSEDVDGDGADEVLISGGDEGDAGFGVVISTALYPY